MKIRYIVYILIYIALLLIILFPNFTHNELINEEGFIKTYFCDEINCAYFLNSFINTSEEVYCAFYDLDEPSIIEQISETNISVKLFEENYEDSMPKNIIPVGSKGLMHHKFCVMGDYILTGSWNPTERGTYKNDNYIIFLKSKSLAENYLLAYDSLEGVQEASPLQVNLSGVIIKNYFCPDHDCEGNILNELDKANISILVLAFSFTSTPIAEKLVEKNNTGVNVKVLFEKTRIASYSQYAYLNASNISVYMDHNSYTMHEKVFVIDDKTVILGSYNPTAAANEKNDENILVIYDEEIAGLFVDEFYSLI